MKERTGTAQPLAGRVALNSCGLEQTSSAAAAVAAAAAAAAAVAVAVCNAAALLRAVSEASWQGVLCGGGIGSVGYGMCGGISRLLLLRASCWLLLPHVARQAGTRRPK